jgi:hypothetical protein
MSEEKNPWGEFKESVSGEFVKWDEVGKEVKGILTDIEQRESSMNPGEMQNIFTLQLEDGTEVRVGGRKSIDSGLRTAVRGQWVLLKYEKDVPSKVKGNNPFKLIKVMLGNVDSNFGIEETEQGAVPFK